MRWEKKHTGPKGQEIGIPLCPLLFNSPLHAGIDAIQLP